MPYEIQLDSFQGPLEVLYQLVKKNRIEISEISLARIAEQYLEYMERIKDFNLDLASEFMVIAAELIEIKVRTLLPRNQDEEGEENDSNLVQRLREYHYFKKVSQVLQEYEEKGSRYYPRAVDIYDIIGEEIEVNLDIELLELQEAYEGVLLSLSDIDEDGGEEDREWEQLKVEEIKIEDKTRFILNKLSRVSSGLTFRELIVDRHNKLEVVVTFLSILELAKMARVKIKQDKVFSNINLN